MCFPSPSSAVVVARFAHVAAYLRRRKVDVVHCHLPLAGVSGRLAGALARVPVVYTEHNLQERYHPLTRRANLVTWRLQRAAVAVSEEVAASIARHVGARDRDRVPVRVVANGVPVDHLRRDEAAGAAVRCALGVPPHAPLVGQVAVFREQKRLDLWLEAAALIARRFPETHFVLVGDGPLRHEVEHRRARLGLTERLHLPGLQSDVRSYLSALDLLMISSDFEGLPLVVLEAMAMEVPVVATAVGGIPEAVSDGETGVLVQPGEPAALAEAGVALVADAARRSAMGTAGRRRAEALFSTERMIRELEELYREVVDRGRP